MAPAERTKGRAGFEILRDTTRDKTRAQKIFCVCGIDVTFREKLVNSLPGRKARAKDPQHPKILGSRTKESPTPPVATSWRRGPTNPESYAPAQLVLEWHRIAEPVGSPRELCREGRRAPRKCLKPPKPQLKETAAFESYKAANTKEV